MDRIDTAIAYITDPASPTVDEIAKRFGCSKTRMHKWSLDDNWGPRRVQFLNRVYTDLRDRLAGTLTKDRLESLEYARALRVRAFKLLDSDIFTASARAYAALLRAFVDLSKYVDGLGMDAAHQIMTGTAKRSDVTAQLPDGVTGEMLDAMNKAFIDAHQARTRVGAAGTASRTIIDADTGEVVDEDRVEDEEGKA